MLDGLIECDLVVIRDARVTLSRITKNDRVRVLGD